MQDIAGMGQSSGSLADLISSGIIADLVRRVPDVITHLQALGQRDDGDIDLAEAALMLAAIDRPEVSLDRYRSHVRDIVSAVEDTLVRDDDGSPEAAAAALQAVLVESFGYHGDSLTYDDLQNANLMRVIDRRKGLPITLGILWIHAGRGQGWDLRGLNFPGHFLVRIERAGRRVVLDPFEQGSVRTTADMRDLVKASLGASAELSTQHYASVSDRDVLLRLQNNIKLRLLRARETQRAAAVIETMLLFAPREASLWREAGLVHAQTGNLKAAAQALERFLAFRSGSHESRHEAARVLDQLKTRLN